MVVLPTVAAASWRVMAEIGHRCRNALGGGIMACGNGLSVSFPEAAAAKLYMKGPASAVTIMPIGGAN